VINAISIQAPRAVAIRPKAIAAQLDVDGSATPVCGSSPATFAI